MPALDVPPYGVSAVARLMEDRCWEDVVDKDTQDNVIAEIEAEAEEELGHLEEDQAGGWAWDDVRGK